MQASDSRLLIYILFILGVGLIWFNHTTPQTSVLTAHIRDSQEQLITAMDLGEPECDAWQTSKDTVVRCMWHTDNRISIMSCDDGRLIPEKYMTNGNIKSFCG